MKAPTIESYKDDGDVVTLVTYGDSSLEIRTDQDHSEGLNSRLKMGLDVALRATMMPCVITPETFLQGMEALADVTAQFARLYQRQNPPVPVEKATGIDDDAATEGG